MRSNFDMSIALNLHDPEAALQRLCAAVTATIAPVHVPFIRQKNRKQLINFCRFAEFNLKQQIHKSFFAETGWKRLSTLVDLANPIRNSTSTNIFLTNPLGFGSPTNVDELFLPDFNNSTSIYQPNRTSLAFSPVTDYFIRGILGKSAKVSKATTVVTARAKLANKAPGAAAEAKAAATGYSRQFTEIVTPIYYPLTDCAFFICVTF